MLQLEDRPHGRRLKVVQLLIYERFKKRVRRLFGKSVQQARESDKVTAVTGIEMRKFLIGLCLRVMLMIR